MAGSIKLFRFIQKFHQTIGIYPSQPNQKQQSTSSTQAIFLICCAQLMLSTVAFVVFEAKSIHDYGFTFYVIISIINVIVIYLIFIWQSENMLKFIKNCEKFIEKRAHSMSAYKKLTAKIEMFNKYFCCTLGFSVGILLYFSLLPYSFARYFIFNKGEESFYLFCPSWYPFNWKTPAGYFVAWLAQLTAGLTILSIYIQFPNFVFGSCWLFIFIAEDITQDLAEFNRNVEKTSVENRAKLTKRFCELANIYLDAKQCVKEFNQMNKYSLFEFFSWTMLGVSSALVTLQFQLWADDSNLFEFLLLLLLLIWMIIFIFILCELGARMTNQFDAFSDELSGCNWYLLSIEIQRIYMIFLSDTQSSMKMLSYANITCERDTFKKIIKTAFSYFMTMRRFKA